MSARERQPSRAAVLVVVLACLVAAAVLDRTGPSARGATEDAVALGPRVPTTRAITTAWYCADGTASDNGGADELIVIAALDARPVRARVTVMPGGDGTPKSRTLEVRARSQTTLRVADVLPAPDPGVLVETAGGRAVVSHAVSGNGDGGVGPCAREPSETWHLAAGTTAKGATLWLALFNPFGDDAIVDIGLLTGSGPLAPEELQGFVVPRRTRVMVPVHDEAHRVDLVATEVIARRGRVVAEQSLALDGTDGRKGLALSLGVPALATHWEFAQGFVTAGRAQGVIVANPANATVKVRVTERLDGDASITPQDVSVPARSAVAVDFGAHAPKDVGFSFRVDAQTPVVAESLVSMGAPVAAPGRGIATVVGVARPARRWVLVPARASDRSTDYLAVAATGTRSVTFRVSVLAGGRARVPTGARRVTLRAGKRKVFDLAALKVPRDGFVVVDASGPVVVEREAQVVPGVTLAAAVPDLGA